MTHLSALSTYINYFKQAMRLRLCINSKDMLHLLAEHMESGSCVEAPQHRLRQILCDETELKNRKHDLNNTAPETQ